MVVSTAIEKSSESAVVLLLIGGDVDLSFLLIWQGLHLIRALYLSSLVEVKYRPPYIQIRSYRIKALTVYCHCTLSQGVVPLQLLSVKVKLASENCIWRAMNSEKLLRSFLTHPRPLNKYKSKASCGGVAQNQRRPPWISSLPRLSEICFQCQTWHFLSATNWVFSCRTLSRQLPTGSGLAVTWASFCIVGVGAEPPTPTIWCDQVLFKSNKAFQMEDLSFYIRKNNRMCNVQLKVEILILM